MRRHLLAGVSCTVLAVVGWGLIGEKIMPSTPESLLGRSYYLFGMLAGVSAPLCYVFSAVAWEFARANQREEGSGSRTDPARAAFASSLLIIFVSPALIWGVHRLFWFL